jgi:putative ABC transport system substrate-binding protein
MTETFLRSTRLFPLILGLLLTSLPAEAQPPAQPPRVGVIVPGAPGRNTELNAFRQGLQDLGHVEGKSILLEARWPEGRLDRQQSFISELVRLPVDVLVVGTTSAALDATRMTTALPIVAVTAGALLEAGVVASLARPGGNVTGLTNMEADLSAKRLALLKEAVPKLSRVTALTSSYSRASLGELYATRTETAARSLGIQFQLRKVLGPSDLEDAFQAAARSRADAVILLPSPFFTVHAKRAGDLALKHHLPSMGSTRISVETGGLMAYSVDSHDLWRRAASYVDRILKGAKPAELPIEQPTKFRLIINLKTAGALGVAIPQSVLLQADEVLK